MRILISPAKKMRIDNDFLGHTALPRFLADAETLAAILRSMTDAQLQALWKCSEKIAKQNIGRLQTMDLRRNLSPALFSYDGIQYQYMACLLYTSRCV